MFLKKFKYLSKNNQIKKHKFNFKLFSNNLKSSTEIDNNNNFRNNSNSNRIISENENKNLTTNLATKFPERFIDYFIKPNVYKFIDRTEFIENALIDNNLEVIYQPKNYGKTFNLKLLKYFLSCYEQQEEKVSLNSKYEFFKNTKIYKSNNFLFESHFSKYPVIYLNFKELDQTSYNDNIEKFKILLYGQFEMIFQFKDFGLQLNDFEKKFIEDFFKNYRNFNYVQIFSAFKELTKILLKLSKNNPFVLIDDYDFPLKNAFNYNFSLDILKFQENLFKNVLKNNNFISKAIITGEVPLEFNHLFYNLSYMGNVHKYSVNNLGKYDNLFGVSVEELTDCLNNNNNINNINNNLLSITKNKNIDFKTASLILNNKIDDAFSLESLAKFNIDYLKLNNLVNFILNDEKSDSYLQAMKTLVLLKKQANKILNNESLDADLAQNNEFDNRNRNLYINSDKDLQLNNIYNHEFLLNYLYHNGILNSEGFIENIYGAKILSNLLKNILKLDNRSNSIHQDLNFNKKLALLYYSCFYNGKYIDFFEGLISLFNEQNKLNTNKKNIDNIVNLSFRLAKDLENYLIDVLTLDMNINHSSDIQILSVEDDENSVSTALKTFTLLLVNGGKDAVFIKALKYKPKNEKEVNDDINEVNINSKSNNFKLLKKSKANTELTKESLKRLNLDALQEIDKSEAINFSKRVNESVENVVIVCFSNSQKFFDFTIFESKILSDI